ncbi:OsmC family protein [Nonlabens ponticola]|uniref:OsmC family peroxiredoxin n=1 Tax=Nonlabens ponticola TaxID=2496866 RepID=A0A3S9MZP6_9FLAO|nr:OsmC family protein [Nonlabens ponticola]AZQ44735.1 OsmC family peroxiredoxin [Nonlabens ponticola]
MSNSNTARVEYLGDLRCRSTHIRSNDSFHTDAPVDNAGKGEAFSPTDTVATALASCMLTVMGIKARDMDIDMIGSTAHVTKHMASNPRRISQIDVELELKGEYDARSRIILEKTALTCPVHNSLNPDITKNVTFLWPS